MPAYRVITLSGEVASGKSSVAVELLNLLPGWQRINTGQKFRDFCTAQGLTIQEVAQLPDEVHRDFDHYQLVLLQKERHTIIEGRLAGWLARQMDDVFTVFCTADVETRVRRYMERDNTSPQEARQAIRYRDREDVKKFRSMYGVKDYRNPEFYDLMLDTSTRSPRALARQILLSAGIGNSQEK